MEVYIDFESLLAGTSQNPFLVSWFLFKSGGWVVTLIVLLWGFWRMWMNFIQIKWIRKTKYIILAVDVPKDSEQQSLKAVENLFEHLAGAQKTPNLIEKYWDGWTQEKLSFEIISMGGYIQFLIRTPAYFCDLVEASIYAQYPEAEITEVEDYMKNIPEKYPNDKYDCWGVEMQLVKPDYYPIKTYINFEHSLTQRFADPLASTLEIMSRLGPGEQVWYQLLISPVDPSDASWHNKTKEAVAKLVGKKVPTNWNFFDKLLDAPLNLLGFVGDMLLPGTPFADSSAAKAEREWPSMMQHMTPGEKDVVEAIDKKMAKTTFQTKVRFIYFAEKKVFNKATRIGALFGALKQYNTSNLNAFKPSKLITRANYFFVKSRVAAKQRRLVQAFKWRSLWVGCHQGFRLNTEELASLWHFPFLIEVKAPLVKKTASKKSEPPMALPVEKTEVKTEKKEEPDEAAGTPPENLPI